jgi:hypothetical protein
VTETETAFQYQHQYPQSHHLPQVHAHAKEQLMNYKQKSQYCKLPLLINHSLSLNHKQPSEMHHHQQQANQADTQTFKSKLKSMPRNFFNLRVKTKMLTSSKTRTKTKE